MLAVVVAVLVPVPVLVLVAVGVPLTLFVFMDDGATLGPLGEVVVTVAFDEDAEVVRREPPPQATKDNDKLKSTRDKNCFRKTPPGVGAG